MTDQLDTTAIPRWLHSQNGAMVPARPDADDHEKCRLYVRAVDYDALCDEVDELREALIRVLAIHNLSMHDADTNADDMARCARAALGQEGDA